MEIIQLLNQLEINEVKELLLSSNLPTSDLNNAPIHFFGMKKNNKLIVTGALEVYGNNAVLRSVAVSNNFQNNGYGKQIVRYLEEVALEMKISHLFLLTTSAENFFKKLKYLPIQRHSCPPKILSSSQFTDICPQSSVCLFKNLKVQIPPYETFSIT